MSLEKINNHYTEELGRKSFEKIVQKKCMDLLSNIGLGLMIEYLSKRYDLTSFEGIGNIPIAPEVIPDNKEREVYLSQKIVREYSALVEKINSPDSAKEYPFVLVGENDPDGSDSILFYDLIPCQENDGQLYSNEVRHDMNVVANAADSYPIIALGHTHPSLEDDELKHTLASRMNKTEREKYKVRKAGLNLSLQDIYQAVYLQEQLARTKVLECVIMYNGDFILVDNNGEKTSKYTSIYGFKDDEAIKLPAPFFSGINNE